MNPKEKAVELVENFIVHTHECAKLDAKQCALIAVDEILEECMLERDWYWEEVKTEIEKL